MNIDSSDSFSSPLYFSVGFAAGIFNIRGFTAPAAVCTLSLKNRLSFYEPNHVKYAACNAAIDALETYSGMLTAVLLKKTYEASKTCNFGSNAFQTVSGIGAIALVILSSHATSFARHLAKKLK